MADEIIQAEKGNHSWTLMHRFNLCYDFLDRAANRDDLALLLVWLRFSALRQLDWQRNYNTKPRELSQAQQRLTLKLAALYQAQSPESREVIRLIFSTLGRGAEGGKGQQIRDDILHIMHRHNLKEVNGHFLEEWHQKLHNNTTPDDIVICQAYLEFLRSNGDLDLFYRTLEQGGVSRERLRNFERPIVTSPQFVPHIKDGLIHDFENYLNLLQSIHSATDLASAVAEAGYCLAGELLHKATWLYETRDNAGISLSERVRTITELRIGLRESLGDSTGADCIRAILYLDLSLEEFLRTVVERNIHRMLETELIEELIELLTENVRLYHPDPELPSCLDLLGNIKNQEPTSRKDRALHFIAVNERINNVLASLADYYTSLLQEKAEYLGRGFTAEKWTIELFSQEIIRAGAPFVLSILLGLVEANLRKTAELGSWQIISRAEAAGRLRVETLMDLQNRPPHQPTVLISDRISGDEEMVDNLTGIVTASTVDVLSHVAVRARNAGVLFACCHEQADLDNLKKLVNEPVVLSITAAGEVVYEQKEARPETDWNTSSRSGERLTAQIDELKAFALGMADFEQGKVGGKAYQLKMLQQSLPDWINLPSSVAIPFGVCEKVLALEDNEVLKTKYQGLVNEVERQPAKILPEIRRLIQELTLPTGLLDDLTKAMKEQGLVLPEDRQTVTRRIKQIWASKWNDRAYYSRKKYGISHQDLVMSVLIQQTIPAEYAFVLHTVNPYTGMDDEMYGEVVVGLGETLCSGYYQGRALSFVCKKAKKATPRLQFYPSKGKALFGGGLMFRSDSNGEDLEDYAGAGLYDSLTLEPPRDEIIDYSKVDLLWQEEARDTFFRQLTAIGIEVEKAMNGEPQDIEGAYADGRFYVVQTRAQVGIRSEATSRPGTRQEVAPECPQARMRIGNQTAHSAAPYAAPFHFAVDNGFDAFEWFPDKKEDGSGWDIGEVSSREIDLIRTTAEDKDIRLSVHAPWWASPLEEDGIAVLLQNIAFAEALGAELFNIHFFADQGLNPFLEKLEPVTAAARKAGLKLAIENTPATGPEECNTFFTLLRERELAGDHVGLCFDLGHANLCEATRNDYVRFLRSLQPHVPIIHAHFHENFGEADNHLPLFTGPSKDDAAGIRLVLEDLLKRNFTGSIILEQWPEPHSLLIEARNRLLELLPPKENGTHPTETLKKTAKKN